MFQLNACTHAIVPSHTPNIEKKRYIIHRITIPLAVLHVAGGGNTYSKLGLFVKAPTGILVSWLLLSPRYLWTRGTRCRNHILWCTYMHRYHNDSYGQIIYSTYRLIIYMRTRTDKKYPSLTHTLWGAGTLTSN